MAKKKAPPPPPTVEELKAEAIARLTHWDRTPKALIPPPTREFVVGEEAVVGGVGEVHQHRPIGAAMSDAELRDALGLED